MNPNSPWYYENFVLATPTMRKIAKLYPLFFRKKQKALPPLKEEHFENILICTGGIIGDTVMRMPAYETVKRNFPQAKLTYMGPKHVRPIMEAFGNHVFDDWVFFEDHPAISNPRAFAKHPFAGLRSLRFLRRRRFDLTVSYISNPFHTLLLHFSKSRRVLGYSVENTAALMTDSYEYCKTIQHDVEKHLDLLRMGGLHVFEENTEPHIVLTEDQQAKNQAFLHEHQLGGKLIIGIHPGSSSPKRVWEHYAELAETLHKRYPQAVFLIFEGPGEHEYAAQITQHLLAQEIEFLLVREKLADYVRLIQTCSLMICNDSGAGHISAALRVPCVSIFGYSFAECFGPRPVEMADIVIHDCDCRGCYGLGDCPGEYKKCVNSISVDEVAQVACARIEKLNA